MAKINVCDFCLKDKVLVQVTRGVKYKGFKIEYCDNHINEVPKDIQKFMDKYWELQGGVPLATRV